MPAKPNSRNWNDVQTAIATVAIVTTLGMWNLFATPAKTTNTVQVEDPVVPPTESPKSPIVVEPALKPQGKIIFTQTAPQTVTAQQPQNTNKKKNNNNGGTVTKTKTS